ncbi:MAG: ShlB/FhaC/HecB family hemolysin secretion/activation protein, partial [Cyanothece sp. SIO1E1]|nr:ShlB/FhaC/HecB family hemolysin secretion/activation protein [Cyanothece sp. SIO1E1]
MAAKTSTGCLLRFYPSLLALNLAIAAPTAVLAQSTEIAQESILSSQLPASFVLTTQPTLANIPAEVMSQIADGNLTLRFEPDNRLWVGTDTNKHGDIWQNTHENQRSRELTPVFTTSAALLEPGSATLGHPNSMALLEPNAVSSLQFTQSPEAETSGPNGLIYSHNQGLSAPILLAQVPSTPIPLDRRPPSQESLPERNPTPLLPPPADLLQPTTPAPKPSPGTPEELPETIFVSQFEVVGSTVFDPEELAIVAKRAILAALSADPDEVKAMAIEDPLINRQLSFAQLFQARSAITEFYTGQGYVTSGALLPPQALENGVITIQVVEGQLEDINVTVLEGRLKPRYIRNRLQLAGAAPLNVPKLLQGLQLLQLNPLIQNISAELSAGTRPGTSLLEVEVIQADPLRFSLPLDNNRSPSVGSFRRGIQVGHANLFGQGDDINFGYTNTGGSNEVDLNYTFPLNARNGTFNFSFGATWSNVIEAPFDVLDIES